MKRSLVVFIVCVSFQIHADNTALSSQLLKLLVPAESAPVQKKPEFKSENFIQKKEASEVKTNLNQPTDPFLRLLNLRENEAPKKLHKEDLKNFHFKYINHLEFSDNCRGFPEFDEKKLTKKEKEISKKYAKLVAKGYECPWYLQYINEQIGFGAFAEADIEEDQMIGEYTGIIIERKQSKDFDVSYGWLVLAPENHPNPNDLYFVDARNAGNFTRFINHSYYPNIKSVIVYSNGQWHMVYVAARPIKKDEQLLVNYGQGYWTARSCKPVEMGL